MFPPVRGTMASVRPERSLLTSLLAEAPLGLAVIGRNGALIWGNPAWFRTTGVPPSAVGSDLRSAPGWGPPAFGEVFDRSVRQGAALTLRAVRLGAPNEEHGPLVDVRVQPTSSSGEAEAPLIVILDDVTEREQARERAELFYASYLTSTNAIEVTDRHGNIVDVNPAFERIYGYARAECLGQKPSLVSSPSTSRSLYTRMWADLLDPARGHWSGEIVNRDRAGGDHPVFLTITAIRNPQGATTHYLGVAVDLTEQKLWERRAAHADKLASIGQLAAGVAHEINTPLASVMLVTESLRRKISDETVRRRLDTISEQVEVAAKIVRGLLDFARRTEPHTAEVDVAQVAREAVAFLRGKQSARIAIEEEYPAEPVPIHGDRAQLMQVLTNVLNNAYEALEGEGRIRLEVRVRGGSAEVEISDTGPGIPSTALPHIFEPFFTTKPEGKGTGLGLAISHGIMQSHNGTITARNRPEGGASFRLVFPLDVGPSPSPWESPE
jgi:PAS domain S-box-containing protein